MTLCPFDTDYDGNCPRHPDGCPGATLEDCDKAQELVSALCERDGAWRMRVPVQYDDSDVLLSRIIMTCRSLLSQTP